MGRRVGALLILFGIGACGASGPRPLRPAAPPDDAVQLAALLPDEVERCVVVRPERLAVERRSLVLVHTWAEPSAFAADLPLVAYATAQAEGAAGRRARRSYYRFAPSAENLRAKARELPVRWLDEPCEGLDCRRPVARWVDARTLEVSLHEWPRRALPISSAACVSLARAESTAFEIGVDATPRMGISAVPEPLSSVRVLTSRGGLVVRTVHRFRDPIVARVYEYWARARGIGGLRSAMVPVESAPLAEGGRHIEQRDERVIEREARLWEELELALEDERLRRHAVSLEQRRSRPAPLTRVNVEDLDVVRHQVRVRRAQLSRLRGAERAEAAQTLATLLERAWRAHPAETELARGLVRLDLDLLSRPEHAEAVARQVLAAGVSAHPEGWRVLRREAASHRGAQALSRALREDGLADGPDALAGAQDLVALREAGVPYEWAEGAWGMARRLLRGPAPDRTMSARLPWSAAIAAVAAAVRLQGSEHATTQVVVRASAAGPARALGQSRPDLVVLRDGPAHSLVAGAVPTTDLLALRRLGSALASAVPQGPVEVVVELTSPSRAASTRLRLSGVVRGGELHVSRADPTLAEAPWELLVRYLARPLAELSTALFPPPELTVRAESPEVAAALRREAEQVAEGACRAAGPVLRCRAPGRPEQLSELLQRFVERRSSQR